MRQFENTAHHERVSQVSQAIEKCFNQDVETTTDRLARLKWLIRTNFAKLLKKEGTRYNGVPVFFGGLGYG